MRWWLVLLIIPTAQAGEVWTYQSSAGWETISWEGPVWFHDRDGSRLEAYQVDVGDQTFWLDHAHTPLATGGRIDAEYPYEDRHAWTLAYEDQPAGAITRSTIRFTDIIAPCAMVLRPDHDVVLHDCTLAGQTVQAGTPIGTVLQVAWDDDVPARIAAGDAEARMAGRRPADVALPAPHRHAGPAWDTAPPEPWGPVGANGDREAAYRAALGDPTMLALQQWLAGKDVWPQAGNTTIRDDGSGPVVTHWFTLSDGTETFGFAVRMTGGLLPESWQTSAPPLAAPRPEAWPTTATLEARLRAHADPTWEDVTAQRWGYRWDDGWVFEVGHERNELLPGPMWWHEEVELVLDGDGQALMLRDLSPRGQSGFTHASAPGMTPSPVQAPTQVPDAAPVAWVAGAGLGALLLRWLLPLFTRLRRERLLDHPVRRRIFDALADQDMHLSMLGRELELANGTLMHHVRQMERAGLIVAERSPGYTVYRRAGQPRDHPPHLVRSETAQRIVARLTEGPRSIRALHDDTGIRGATVRWHLERMWRAGMLTRERGPSGFIYRLAGAP